MQLILHSRWKEFLHHLYLVFKCLNPLATDVMSTKC